MGKEVDFAIIDFMIVDLVRIDLVGVPPSYIGCMNAFSSVYT